MSFVSTLTWTCMELQGSLENPGLSEDEKQALVFRHLKETEQCSNREAFPDFQSGKKA